MRRMNEFVAEENLTILSQLGIHCIIVNSKQQQQYSSRMSNQPNSFAVTQSTFEGQEGNRRENKNSNPQLNGAPLTNERNRFGGIGRKNERSFWGENPESDSFLTLLKILQSNEEGVKFQYVIMHNQNAQKTFKNCLRNFIKSEENQQEYKEKYEKKQHLGLSMDELGFKNGAVLEESEDLNIFWKKLIEIASKALSTNKAICYKVVRKYVKDQAIFKKLYDQQIGGQALKPKTEQINTFFRPGSKDVDQQGGEFMILLRRVTEVYFQEFSSCIYCLTEIFDEDNRIKYSGLRGILADSNNNTDSMLKNLWTSYCGLSKQTLEPNKSSVLSEKEAAHQKFKKQLFTKKIKLLINLIKLFYSYLASFQDGQQASHIHNQENFEKTVISKLDADIIRFQKADICSGVNTDSFSRFIVQLFLMLFPFQWYQKPDRNRHKINEITNQLKDIKSQPLMLLKLLLVDNDGPKDISKKIKQFEEAVDKGQWNAFNTHWKKWLGIFLFKYKEQYQRFSKQLTKKIISLCKSVVTDEFDRFWSDQRQFYLEEIQNFLTFALSKCSETNNYAMILPICIKLMGNIANHQCTNRVLTQLLTCQATYDIFNSIIFSLKIDFDRHGQGQRQRIVYISRDEDQNLQQEIKFICKLVQIKANQLWEIEGILLDDQIYQLNQHDINKGTLLIIKLLQILYAISSQTVSGLKCLRYLINAINSLFIFSRTRSLVCIALAVVEGVKMSYSKTLKAIVNRCYDYDVTSELGRQTQKLRLAISYHLNCIVRTSDNLEQYFPTATQREINHHYRTLQNMIMQQNKDKANELILKIKSQGLFKTVSWFYQFAKLLESNKLTAIDIDTIRLLFLKMRIKNEEARQYSNLAVIVDIINNGKLPDIITAAFTPIVKRQKFRRNQQKYFLGLANRDFEGFMAKCIVPEYLSAFKYLNRAYKLQKQRYRYNQQKFELYRKFSGCLSIIETLLRLTLEGDFPLVKKLKVNTFIKESLFGSNPYMYKVKFSVRLEKPKDQKNALTSLLSNAFIDQEMESSVNLIHCISSYWDFEERMDIDESEHPSSSIQLRGHFSRDFQTNGNKREIFREIINHSQESILTDFTRKPESAGINTVGKILEYIVLLGEGKTLYYSLLSRSYPLTKGLLTSKVHSPAIDEFMRGIIQAAIKKSANMREKRQIIELLSVLIQEKHFGEYIRTNISRFKEALASGRDFADLSQSTFLITQFLLFLNLLLNLDSGEANIRFAKSCLADPVDFGNRLLEHCETRLNCLSDSNKGKESKYLTFLWSINVREAASCKLALLLFLGVTTYLLSNEHQSLCIGLCNLVLSKSQKFLKKQSVFFTSNFEDENLKKLGLKESERDPEFLRASNHTHFIFNEIFLNAILFNSPYSFTDNYLEQPWQILQSCSRKQAKELVLAAHRYNSFHALLHASEALVQFYYLLLNSLFQRGHYGLFFLCFAKNEIKQQLPLKVIFKKEKAKNGLSAKLLFGENEGFLSCCFRIYRDIERQIWQSPPIIARHPRDIGLTVIVQILQSIECFIANQPHHLPECNRVIDKLISSIKGEDHRFNFTLLALVMRSILKLINKLLQIIQTKKTNLKNGVSTYFQRVDFCLNQIIINVNLETLTKISEEHLYTFLLLCLYVFDSEIQNIQYFQNAQQLVVYIQNDFRFSLLDKLKEILKSMLSLLNLTQIPAHITALIIQLCTKALYIDHLSKKAKIINIARPYVQQLFTKLDSLSSKLSSQDVLMSTFLAKFVMEVAVLGESEQIRNMMRMIRVGFNHFQNRLKKATQVKTLSEIVQCSNMIGAFASLGAQVQHWRNEQYQCILDKVFIILQEKPFRFQLQKINPQLALQHQLNTKRLDESKLSKSPTIFSLYVSFSMYELAKNYLMFLSFSLKSSVSLYQLCNITFNKGCLEDLSLDRLRESLINIIIFMSKFITFFNTEIEETLKINDYACVDHQFIREMNLIPLNFQRYTNKYDFYSNLCDTFALIKEAIQLLCETWQKYEWKSTSDWRPNIKELLIHFQKLKMFYRAYFRDHKELQFENKLRLLCDQIKMDIDNFNF